MFYFSASEDSLIEPLLDSILSRSIECGAITGEVNEATCDFIRLFLRFQRMEHDRGMKECQKNSEKQPKEKLKKKVNPTKHNRKLSAVSCVYVFGVCLVWLRSPLVYVNKSP